MKRNKLTIGLFGYGCVGKGLYEVLQKTPTLKTKVKTICVKNETKKRDLPQEYFTYYPQDILDDPEIDVVVELIDDATAAFQIVSEAIRKGKAVVSANKKMIAEHFEELYQLQKEHHVSFLYEAACCASIPIIRNLEEYYDHDLLESIEGIVNGSTNYILTKISQEKISYEKALKKAQQEGYAESDPSLDTGGFDAKYKLLILVAHAFGLVVNPTDIFNIGIDHLGEMEMNYAQEKNLKIKLVARAYKDSKGDVTAFVMPSFVHASDRLYTVNDVFNGLRTKTAFADTQFFIGKGAGAYPTASAVLSDLSALSYDYRYEYKKKNKEEKLKSKEDIVIRIILRHDVNEQDDIKSQFIDTSESYQKDDLAYIIGTLTLQQLQKLYKIKGKAISAVLLAGEE